MQALRDRALRRLGVLAGLMGLGLALTRTPAQAVAIGALAAIVARIVLALVPMPARRRGGAFGVVRT